MVVKISRSELVFCWQLASMRYHANVVRNVKEHIMSKRDPIDIHVDGVISEYAFCKHYNVFLNCDTEPRSAGFDALANGYRFDIKSTRNPLNPLWINQKINKIVDYYTLAIISEDRLSVDFKGYIKYLDARCEDYATVRNNEILYQIPQSKLTKYKEDKDEQQDV